MKEDQHDVRHARTNPTSIVVEIQRGEGTSVTNVSQASAPFFVGFRRGTKLTQIIKVTAFNSTPLSLNTGMMYARQLRGVK
ncbi:hypothetical protein TNCT_544261 [Trichonephila clavata]|uniref:Uncharacterized protein n=1 Tax=Trichonephila clavata TaxID=2740835 RepID=A0A8X6J5T3_TRICU|nr:hypothetical protein TNCT_544261 [Trichonephila clavata]